MDNPLLSLLTGVVSGAITAVVTYFATYAKARLEVTLEYAKELHDARLSQYKELWKLLKPLAPYSPEQPLTPKIVQTTSESMRDWYFDQGGIYLSRESRDPYFALKKEMQDIIDDPKLQKENEAPLAPKRVKLLVELGSALRKVLSDDMGTRRQPFV